MMFCFALVFIQQHQNQIRIAAAKDQAYKKAHPQLSPSSLKTITPLTPVTVAQPPANANSANPQVDAPPQPSKTSGSAVQGAAQNNRPDSVIDKVANPVRQILQ